MPDDKDKLIKPPDPAAAPSGTSLSKAGGGIKITGKSRLHSALASQGGTKVDPETSFKQAAEAASASAIDKTDDPNTAMNRIAIMADVSGSMSSADRGSSHSKIALLKMALGGFINQINPETTSVAIYTFPLPDNRWDDEDENPQITQGVSHRLSRDKNLLQMTVNGLQDGGGTPMHSTMSKVLAEISLTRGIIVSDGDADVPSAALEQARAFAASETVIDCVHIGSSAGGENLLSQIASITGGLYLKFDNVENFSKAFSFLSPENRAKLALAAGPQATLAEKAEVARQLGAKEIK